MVWGLGTDPKRGTADVDDTSCNNPAPPKKKLMAEIFKTKRDSSV